MIGRLTGNGSLQAWAYAVAGWRGESELAVALDLLLSDTGLRALSIRLGFVLGIVLA